MEHEISCVVTLLAGLARENVQAGNLNGSRIDTVGVKNEYHPRWWVM